MASTSLTFTALADSPIGLRIKKHWHVVVLTLVFLGVSLTGLASLPVIDRDEARFAQASVQMAGARDLLGRRETCGTQSRVHWRARYGFVAVTHFRISHCQN